MSAFANGSDHLGMHLLLDGTGGTERLWLQDRDICDATMDTGHQPRVHVSSIIIDP